MATPNGLNIFDSKSNEFIKDVLFKNQKVVDVAKVDTQSFLVLTETSLCKLSFLPNGSFNAIQVLNSNKYYADARFCFGKKEIFIWSPNQSSFIQYNKNIGTINELSIKNNITAKEYELLEQKFPQDWRNGIKHSIPISFPSFNVAKYVPYGPVRFVLPYLLRRVEENTSVKGQTGRELSLIKKERQRRKNENK